jgi:hypothetical protein
MQIRSAAEPGGDTALRRESEAGPLLREQIGRMVDEERARPPS